MASFVMATPAQAHADLVNSTPAHGDEVSLSSDRVALTFSVDLIAAGATIVVRHPQEREVVAHEVAVRGNTVSAQLSMKTPGLHTLTYRVVGQDGHAILGELSFTAVAPPPGQPSALSAPSPGNEATTPDEASISAASTSRRSLIWWPVWTGAGVLILLIHHRGRRRRRDTTDRGRRSRRPTPFRPTRRDLRRAVALAYGAGGVVHLVHAHETEQRAVGPWLHWLRDSSLAVPLALAAVIAGVAASRLVQRWVSAEVAEDEIGDEELGSVAGLVVTASAYALFALPGNLVHQWLFVGDAGHGDAGSSVHHLLADGSVALMAAVAVLLLDFSLPRLALRAGARRPLLAVVSLVAATLAVTPLPNSASAAVGAEAVASCGATTAQRSYDVAAISVPIPYNRFGDIDPNGMVYVFEQDRAAVQNWHHPLNANAAADPASNRRLRPRPIVIRANVGECVEVTFTNRLSGTALDGGAVSGPRASMHVSGAATSANRAGAHVGFAEDSTVGTGQTITYYWKAPDQEGLHVIRDMGMSAGGEADGGSISHGLWGGFAVEPAGSTWFDSHSGLPLYPVSEVAQMSGELYLDADVVLPDGKSFRETVQISQDEIPNVGFGFNYGADAQANRDEQRCPDCVGEETSLSSWTYGDPAAVKLASGLAGPMGWDLGADASPEDCQSDEGTTAPKMMMPPGIAGGCWTSNVTHSYKGDPTKIRFAHAGVKETHVFHMHAHQWLAEPHDVGDAGTNPTRPSDTARAQSTTIDSQTYGPGDAYTADLLFGAGSKPGTIGDSMFHCHLYPHFAGGFWSLFRVHDVHETGRLETPDGMRTRLLTVLPDREAHGDLPSEYDARTNPGYPRFIPGQFGWRAPQPPGTVSAPDGSPATRIVAGQGLDPALLNATQDVTADLPHSGTFSLTYRGENTTALPADAPPEAVAAALEALGTIDEVDVTALGTSGTAWRVEFLAPSTNVRRLSTDQAQVSVRTVESELARALETEAAAQMASYAGTGRSPKPGAPFTDPCPSGAREVTYDVSVMQRDLVYNDAGWHDTQGRILVLTKDVPEIMAGTKTAEPLFFRVNAGDCINFNLTNMLPNWYGNDAFQVLQQTNMFGEHIHLVKFDVLGSDGSSNGWNYQQAAYTQAQAAFDQDVIDGDQRCSTDEAQGACRLPLPGPDGYDPTVNAVHSGQTIHERWYADYELRTVFTHDHHFPAVDQGRGLFGGLIVEPSGMDFRDSRTGAYRQPINNPAHGTICSGSCTGDAAGAMFDVIGPGAKDDFREFGLAFQDFVPLTRAGGNPQDPADVLNPPAVPEGFADNDPGVMGINYRNEPFLIRDTVNGARTDPAYVFSSTLHGDPATPLLQAYAGDPVRIRLIAGSQEEQHVFGLHGMRWRDEPDDPASQFQASKSLGVSDAFNFEIPEMDCVQTDDCAGDYLYSSTATDDLYLGMWGLMRVYGKGRQGLLPLPDNEPQAANGNTTNVVTGLPPEPARKPGDSCAPGAPPRSFTLVATDTRIDYNRDGDHDPYGLVYGAVERGETVDQAVARIRMHPEPLSLRANEGDCIDVRLHNRIDPNGKFAALHAPQGVADGDPSLPLEPPTGTPTGLRVSLHPQLMRYDIRGSDGATVGFNRDQTAGPGQQVDYRWFADDVTPGELGTLNLTDYGDVRGHRHHGLFAALTIEPRGATYHDPFTGRQIISGTSADIRIPGRPDFREFTAFQHDGLNLRDAAGAQVPDGSARTTLPGEGLERLDSEDEGEKGLNYGSSPYRHRLGITPAAADATNPMSGSDLASVLSSARHGDPDTAIFRAYAGDPVRIRVVQGADKPRQHDFTVHGHNWLSDPNDRDSNRVGQVGGMSVGRTANIEITSAGNGTPGDWFVGDDMGFHHLSGGSWGLLRTYTPPSADPLFDPDPLATGAEQDNPYRSAYQPLLPLELSRVVVDVFEDTDMDGIRDAAETRGPDSEVTLSATDDSGRALTRPVNAQGNATFWVSRAAYDVTASLPAGWKRTTPTPARIDLTADGADAQIGIGLVQLESAGVRLFNDKNGIDGMEAGEDGLAGWTVQLTRGTTTRTAATDGSGLARFDGLEPGTWSVASPGQAGWRATRALPVSLTVAGDGSWSGGQETRIGFSMPAGLAVKIFNDANDNGAQDAGESNKAGWTVTATGGPHGTTVVTATTDAQGVATLDDPGADVAGLAAGAWQISVGLAGDWMPGKASATTTAGTTTSPTPGFVCGSGRCDTVLLERTSQVATLPVRNDNSWLEATSFNDTNNDGVRQDRESRLTGWNVTAISSNGFEQAVESGSNGRATFYPAAPGQWTLEMISPERSDDPNVLAWTSTNKAGCAPYGTTQRICTVTVDVKPGETGTALFGFVQLGTVGVDVFHDYDKDAIRDDNEPAQPNRTIGLYDATGKTLLQQKVTDSQGHVGFKVAKGVKYQVRSVAPSGWVLTSPLDGRGRTLTSIPVTGPSGTTSLTLTIGQYNTLDSTAPPAPTSGVAPGTYSGPQAVELTSETGSTIRYTLGGAMPTATTGVEYTGPIIVAFTRKLRAIAIDSAGNVSAELSTPDPSGTGSTPGYQFDIAGNSISLSPGGWTVLSGGTPFTPTGYSPATALADDDGTRLLLPSPGRSTKKQYLVDGYASVMVPPTLRNPSALGVELDGRTNLTGSTRSLAMWDFDARSWVPGVGGIDQPIVDLRSVYDLTTNLGRFVDDATGEVRIRYTAVRTTGTYDAQIDQVRLQVTQ